jgi:hypothetical protein
MRLLATLILCAPLLAQSFQIVPSTAPRGGAGSLLITLTSPAGKEPVALQWKLMLGTEVTAAKEDIAAGAAATTADKVVECGPVTRTGAGRLNLQLHPRWWTKANRQWHDLSRKIQGQTEGGSAQGGGSNLGRHRRVGAVEPGAEDEPCTGRGQYYHSLSAMMRTDDRTVTGTAASRFTESFAT